MSKEYAIEERLPNKEKTAEADEVGWKTCYFPHKRINAKRLFENSKPFLNSPF